MKNMRYVESLNLALHRLMNDDDKVVILGEDILDPYGGAFKVTKGLSTTFPDRVFTTPISEAAITGLAAGLAIRGYKPILEIMFGDFITLCSDQIINGASKFNWMYGDKFSVPLVIRTPMGGGRGYGPTHSQSIEKIFFGIPGLSVISPSHFHNPGQELITATYDKIPTIFIENKLLYPKKLFEENNLLQVEAIKDGEKYTTVVVRNFDKPISPDLTVVTYGGVSRIIENLLIEFAEEEIWIEVIFPSLISPLTSKYVIQSAQLTGRVLVVEEGSAEFSWGKEIAYEIQCNVLNKLKSPVKCIGSKLSVIPASFDLEQQVIINSKQIENAIMMVLN